MILMVYVQVHVIVVTNNWIVLVFHNAKPGCQPAQSVADDITCSREEMMFTWTSSSSSSYCTRFWSDWTRCGRRIPFFGLSAPLNVLWSWHLQALNTSLNRNRRDWNEWAQGPDIVQAHDKPAGNVSTVPQDASIPKIKVRDFLHETVPVFLPLTPGNGLRPTMDALRFKADPGQNNRLRGSISNSV